MDLGIAGKWALVCGSSKGLGLGCAQALVREGVHVVMVARGAEALEAAVEKLIADAGRPTEIEIFLRDGRLAGRYVSVPDLDALSQT